MATEVDIYNLALSHIGDAATVASVSEASVQRQICSRFYPQVLRTVLSKHPWSFALRREALVQVTNDSTTWLYKYAKPNLHILSVAVLDAEANDDTSLGYAFRDLGDYIYCNVENAWLLFVFYQDDTGKFSPMFVDTVSYLLASRIAGPRIKGAMGRQERNSQFQAYTVALAQATASDANASNDVTEYVPANVRARGGRNLMAIDDALSRRNWR